MWRERVRQFLHHHVAGTFDGQDKISILLFFDADDLGQMTRIKKDALRTQWYIAHRRYERGVV